MKKIATKFAKKKITYFLLHSADINSSEAGLIILNEAQKPKLLHATKKIDKDKHENKAQSIKETQATK